MPDKIFFDTNILVYLSNEDSLFFQEVQKQFNSILNNNVEIWISRQILREYAVVMTRSEYVEKPLNKIEVLDDLERWQKIFNVADETEDVTNCLMDLIKKYDLMGKKIHDANIVATMITKNIPELLTYNIGDFNVFEEIKIKTKK